MSGPHAADAGWDDDRLAAAFRARSSAASLPPLLVTTTVERLRAQRGAGLDPWDRLRLVVAPVAVVVVFVLIAGSFIELQPTRVPPSTRGPSTLEATPQASDVGRPSPADSPNQVFGLNIISVTDAIAIRDAGRDGREIAVRGWYWPFVDPRCPFIVDRIPPVQFGCGDMLVAITQDPKDGVRDGEVGVLPPSISPSFDQIDPRQLADVVASMNPRRCGTRRDCPSPRGAISIVTIGHFDDRRAELCEVTMRAECRDRFVVDRLDSIDGQPVPTSVFDEVNGNHVWRAADAEMVDPGDSNEPILSISVVSGTQNKSLSIEPSLVTRSSWSGAGAVWLVRRLVGGDLVTHAIVDGTDRVFAIQDDGSLKFVTGSLPASDDVTWPPNDSIDIARETNSEQPLTVAVVDMAGHLLEARASKVDMRPVPDDDERRLWLDRLDDRSLLVRWSGGLCDHRLLLTVRGDANGLPNRIFLDGRRGGVCRSMRVNWKIELRFDGDIDPAMIATQYGISTEGGP